MVADTYASRMASAEDEKASLAQAHASQASLTVSEKRRVGKVYSKETALDQVVAQEMSRIRKAFD